MLKHPNFLKFLNQTVAFPRFFSELVQRIAMHWSVASKVFHDSKPLINVMSNALSSFVSAQFAGVTWINSDCSMLIRFVHDVLFGSPSNQRKFLEDPVFLPYYLMLTLEPFARQSVFAQLSNYCRTNERITIAPSISSFIALMRTDFPNERPVQLVIAYLNLFTHILADSPHHSATLGPVVLAVFDLYMALRDTQTCRELVYQSIHFFVMFGDNFHEQSIAPSHFATAIHLAFGDHPTDELFDGLLELMTMNSPDKALKQIWVPSFLFSTFVGRSQFGRLCDVLHSLLSVERNAIQLCEIGLLEKIMLYWANYPSGPLFSLFVKFSFSFVA
jgi:hypothetical protein